MSIRNLAKRVERLEKLHRERRTTRKWSAGLPPEFDFGPRLWDWLAEKDRLRPGGSDIFPCL
jgi:hypothetical protein